MTSVGRVSREQILAFRLGGHHLLKRSPHARLTEVAGACGIRNTPPGSALLALHARINGMTPDTLDEALGNGGGALAEVLGMRISPVIVPVEDLAIFTLGALPREEASARAVLTNLKGNLDDAKLTALGAIEQAAEAAEAELADGPLERGALSAGMTRRLPKALGPFCKPCGTHHVFESLFRLAGVSGAFVIERDGKRSLYVHADRRFPSRSRQESSVLRDDLLQRFLHCFGPATPQDFAAWVGIANGEARADFDRVADSLVEVEVEDGHEGAKRTRGRTSAPVVHRDDLPRLQQPAEPDGVRFLPPYDAYLDQRDRLTLIQDKDLHKRVWSSIGGPGTLLANGEIAGIWRARKAGKRLAVTVEPLGPLPKKVRSETEAEAEALGPIRGCSDVEVTISE